MPNGCEGHLCELHSEQLASFLRTATSMFLASTPGVRDADFETRIVVVGREMCPYVPKGES